jgi:hypothetical protein
MTESRDRIRKRTFGFSSEITLKFDYGLELFKLGKIIRVEHVRVYSVDSAEVPRRQEKIRTLSKCTPSAVQNS